MHHDSSKFQPRQATAFYYLNDVTRGGETYFPAADGAVNLGTALAMSEPSADGPGLAVKPRRGTALIFYNHDAAGVLSPLPRDTRARPARATTVHPTDGPSGAGSGLSQSIRTN